MTLLTMPDPYDSVKWLLANKVGSSFAYGKALGNDIDLSSTFLRSIFFDIFIYLWNTALP